MSAFKSCPLCGKTKRLQITSEDQYLKIFNGTGSAAIRVECMDCDIELWEHTYKEPEYSKRLEILADKWNALPRRGDELSAEEMETMIVEKVKELLHKLEEGA